MCKWMFVGLYIPLEPKCTLVNGELSYRNSMGLWDRASFPFTSALVFYILCSILYMKQKGEVSVGP